MTFHKLPHSKHGKRVYCHGRDSRGELAWVSENFIYLVSLIDGEKAFSDGFYDGDHDYVRFCILDIDGGAENVLVSSICSKDGVAAFIVKELMDISDRYESEGEASVIKHVVRRIGLLGHSTVVEWPAEYKAGVAARRWRVVNLPDFHRYKERSR